MVTQDLMFMLPTRLLQLTFETSPAPSDLERDHADVARDRLDASPFDGERVEAGAVREPSGPFEIATRVIHVAVMLFGVLWAIGIVKYFFFG